jgi:hypothetical protein
VYVFQRALPDCPLIALQAPVSRWNDHFWNFGLNRDMHTPPLKTC